MVNLQTEPSILKGLLSTLQDRQWADCNTNQKINNIILNTGSKILKSSLSKDFVLNSECVDRFVGVVREHTDSVKSLSILIDELVVGLGKITLVIDEANIAFKISADTSQDKN